LLLGLLCTFGKRVLLLAWQAVKLPVIQRHAFGIGFTA